MQPVEAAQVRAELAAEMVQMVPGATEIVVHQVVNGTK